MNAREFYEEFKDMLNFVGVGFAEMENAVITFHEGKVIVTAGQRSACLEDLK